MKNKKKIILILISVLTVLLIRILIKNSEINNRKDSVRFYSECLDEKFSLIVSFKNTGRQWGIYLSKDVDDVIKIAKENYPIGDPYKYPIYPDIEFSIISTGALFDKSKIGDTIKKLPNSNKCYLYKKDSIFRYNCWIIPEDIRVEIGNIEEWKSDEIGFWKVR